MIYVWHGSQNKAEQNGCWSKAMKKAYEEIALLAAVCLISIFLLAIFINWNITKASVAPPPYHPYDNTDQDYIDYIGNGGSGEPEDQPLTFGMPVTLSGVVPVHPQPMYYEFIGWSVDDRTNLIESQIYKPGSLLTYTPADSKAYRVYLYAQWRPKTYKVYPVLDGGTLNTPYFTKTSGRNLYLSSFKPMKDGYAFIGWREKPTDRTAITDTVLSELNLTEDEGTAAVMYAVWAKTAWDGYDVSDYVTDVSFTEDAPQSVRVRVRTQNLQEDDDQLIFYLSYPPNFWGYQEKKIISNPINTNVLYDVSTVAGRYGDKRYGQVRLMVDHLSKSKGDHKGIILGQTLVKPMKKVNQYTVTYGDVDYAERTKKKVPHPLFPGQFQILSTDCNDLGEFLTTSIYNNEQSIVNNPVFAQTKRTDRTINTFNANDLPK